MRAGDEHVLRRRWSGMRLFLSIGPDRKAFDDPPRVWRWRITAIALTVALALVLEYVLKPLGFPRSNWNGALLINPNGIWLVLLDVAIFYAEIGGCLVLIWGTDLYLERRVYLRFQTEQLCINCFYRIDRGNPENPLCPECGFSKTVSHILRRQFRWGKWADRTFTRREREPGKYADGGSISTRVRLPYGKDKGSKG